MERFIGLPLLQTSAIKNEGIGLLIEDIEKHKTQLLADDVHLAADAPAGPGDARLCIQDTRVRLVELDVEVFQYGVPEPLEVLGGPLKQLTEGGDAVAIHEPLQMASRNILRGRLPYGFTAEFKLLHLLSYPSSQSPAFFTTSSAAV